MKLAVNQKINVGYYKGVITHIDDALVYVRVATPGWNLTFKKEEIKEDLYDKPTQEWRAGHLKEVSFEKNSEKVEKNAESA